MEAIIFPDRDTFRAWLEQHHATEKEVWVGYYKKVSGKTSISYKEAVEEALCFGWIDGIGRSIDAESHANRFTPRKKGSIWSAVNIAKVAELTEQGRMHPAGLKTFDERDMTKQGLYSHEQDEIQLGAENEARLKANEKAWAYWSNLPPGYRRSATWWVISAKKDETKEKRLLSLIEHCEQEKRLPQFVSPRGKS